MPDVPPESSRELLFGLVSLHNGLIDPARLAAVLRDWEADKSRPVADRLVEQGVLTDADRTAVEVLVERQLDRSGGDASKSVAGMNGGWFAREVLGLVNDPELRAVLQDVSTPGDLWPGTVQAAFTRPDEAEAEAEPGRGGPRFRLLRPHARGGLGEVFVAVDAELGREVALKQILERLADHPDSRRRFLLEAEITGGLEHPGIVPVYGLGVHPNGRPYYAMRFIKGDTLHDAINEFHSSSGSAARTIPGEPSTEPATGEKAGTARAADPAGASRELDLRKLLRRFQDVCNALHYAHSRGVLHRDIKPANIIVGKYGETLLVDWGLAKARGEAASDSAERPLHPSSASGSGETLPGEGFGTPAYMSPEQARGELDRLDARSDVYSLGATLYQILTGRHPLTGRKSELLEAVQRGDIPRPRSLDPTIDPALEAVCQKAMSLNPEDRYPSARLLSDDLDRWLADEPVTAYVEPFSRRARRWGRRNRTLVTTAAALLVLSAVGMSVFGFVVQGKNRELLSQRNRAEDREKLAIEAVKRFGDAVTNHSELKNNLALRTLRTTLLKEPFAFFRDLRVRLQADDQTIPASHYRLAEACYELGRLTHQIGDAQDAIALERQAIGIVESLASSDPKNDEYQNKLAQLYINFGLLLSTTGEREKALTEYRRSLRINQKRVVAVPDATALLGLAAVYNNIGEVERDTGRTASAERSYDEARAIQERLVREHPEVPEYRNNLAIYHNNVGRLQQLMGKYDAAVRSYEASRAIRNGLVRENPKDPEFQNELGACHFYLGLLLDDMGRASEALHSIEEAVAVWGRLVRENPSVSKYQRDLARGHVSLGRLQRALGRPEDSLRSYGQAVAIDERLARENPTVTEFQKSLANDHNNLGNLQATTGRPKEALRSYEQAREILDALVRANPLAADEQRDLARTYNGIGALHLAADEFESARKPLEQSVAIRERLAQADPRNLQAQRELAGGYSNLGILRRAAGHPAEAVEVLEKSLAIDERLAAEHPESPEYAGGAGGTLNNIALIDLDAKRFGEARTRLQQAIVWQRKALAINPRNPTYRRFLANHLRNLIDADQALGRQDEAEQARRELKELDRSDPRFAVIDARLAAVSKGDVPKDNTERLALAKRAYDLGRHVVATKLWVEAFASDSTLCDDRQAQHRYNASCAAALAAAGKSRDRDEPPPDEAAKARHRDLALGLLRAELDAWAKFLDTGPPQAKEFVRQTLDHWTKDTDLAGVRDPEALAQLSDKEKQAWGAFWADVAALRAR